MLSLHVELAPSLCVEPAPSICKHAWSRRSLSVCVEPEAGANCQYVSIRLRLPDSPSLPPSPSLSLTYSHSHTRTLSLDLSPSLCLSACVERNLDDIHVHTL
jgi:hypothetical protein